MTDAVLDRRGFLELLGCGGCAIALSATSGCTIAEVFGDGGGVLEFDVNTPRYAALKAIDGVVAVDTNGRSILLIRTDADTVVALSRICTHTACDMAPDLTGRWDGEKLICTCHDSHFAPDGRVLKGPATRDLANFSVQFDGTEGAVQLGGDPPPDMGTPAGPAPLPPEFVDLSNPLGDDPAAVTAGEALYAQCASCHGEAGAGDGLPLTPPPSAFDVEQSGWSDGYLFWRIRTGRLGGPAGSAMPAYPELSDEEVWQLVSYLRSLAP